MQAIDPRRRAELSILIREARESRRWSQERLADRAEAALRRQARQVDGEYSTGSTAPEPNGDLGLYLRVEISRHHVATLENCPARPLGDAERRARLMGIVLALGLDRAVVNQLAGGI